MTPAAKPGVKDQCGVLIASINALYRVLASSASSSARFVRRSNSNSAAAMPTALAVLRASISRAPSLLSARISLYFVMFSGVAAATSSEVLMGYGRLSKTPNVRAKLAPTV